MNSNFMVLQSCTKWSVLTAFFAFLLNGNIHDAHATENGKPVVAPQSLTNQIAGTNTNGDSTADILWRDKATGNTFIWLMGGAAIWASGSAGVAVAAWDIQGTGDFNGDGRADILWRHTDGATAIWFMNGTTQSSAGFPGSASMDWQIRGIGDFNADNKADIVWRNRVTGATSIWLLNGATVIGYASPGGAGTEWDIKGIGDFNGDGKTDLLWWNSSTAVTAVWLLNGTTFSSSGYPGSSGSAWRISDVNDFNGDNKTDIVWRNTQTGGVSIWLMNGTALTSAQSPPGAGLEWTIKDADDFDGNGSTDLLWHNTNGSVAIRRMTGTTISSVAYLGSMSTNWELEPSDAPQFPPRSSQCGTSAGCVNVSVGEKPSRTIDTTPFEPHFLPGYQVGSQPPYGVLKTVGAIKAGESLTLSGTLISILSSIGSVEGTDKSDWVQVTIPAGVSITSASSSGSEGIHYCGSLGSDPHQVQIGGNPTPWNGATFISWTYLQFYCQALGSSFDGSYSVSLQADRGEIFIEINGPGGPQFFSGSSRVVGLAFGNYTIKAGTDADRDGILCETGDFCGSTTVTIDQYTVKNVSLSLQ